MQLTLFTLLMVAATTGLAVSVAFFITGLVIIIRGIKNA